MFKIILLLRIDKFLNIWNKLKKCKRLYFENITVLKK